MARTKGLKPLKGIRGLKSPKALRFATPVQRNIPGDDSTLNLEEPGLAEWVRRLDGDERTARRCWTLRSTTYPYATLPELVTYDWLASQQIDFRAQVHFFGGRARAGGVVPDVLVRNGSSWDAWLINGQYWHSEKFNQGKDAAQRVLLRGKEFDGRRIRQVVLLWERRIYQERPQVFLLALGGVELGP